MAKYTLDTELEFNFTLFGLVCHEREYRICSFLNREMGFDFEREKSLEIKIKKWQRCFLFSLFSSVNQENENKVYLISNKSSDSYKEIKQEKSTLLSGLFDEVEQDKETRYHLIPEKSDMDYFLMMSGDFSSNWVNTLKNNLTASELILNCTEIDPNKLNSKINLLF